MMASNNSVERNGDRDGGRVILRVDRRFCSHCQEYLSFKTYNFHERLYYNFICDKWTLKHPVDTSEAPDTAHETPPSSFGKLADGEDDDNEAWKWCHPEITTKMM